MATARFLARNGTVARQAWTDRLKSAPAARRAEFEGRTRRELRKDELAAAVLKACDDGPYTAELPPLWDGQAGPRIARIITAWLDL